jgi:glycosyltransferase involved in cell wall biosynthesis
MKICLLAADLGVSLTNYNGAAAHIRSLVAALKALGHEILVVTASETGTTELGVPIVTLPVPHTFEPLLEWARQRIEGRSSMPDWDRLRVARALGHVWNNVMVEQVLERTLPDFGAHLLLEIYSPFGVAGGVVARRVGLRHVLNAHAPLAWEGSHFRRQPIREAADTLEDAAFAFTSLVVANSRELRDQLVAAGVPATKIEIVPNGVDVDLFTPDGPTYLSGMDGKLVIGFVGSLKAWHGIEVLIDTFKLIADDPRFHLLIVGDGPMAKQLHALGEELPGRVTLVGAVPQDAVPTYLRRMDITVAPYPRLERFYFSPLKILEYMAAGRAVIASNIGQIEELVRDGVTGLLVPPGDVAAMAQAILALAADPDLRSALGHTAEVETRRAHTWKQRAAEIVELAEGLADSGNTVLRRAT